MEFYNFQAKFEKKIRFIEIIINYIPNVFPKQKSLDEKERTLIGPANYAEPPASPIDIFQSNFDIFFCQDENSICYLIIIFLSFSITFIFIFSVFCAVKYLCCKNRFRKSESNQRLIQNRRNQIFENDSGSLTR